MKKIDKSIALAVLIGFLVGSVFVVGMRFITYESDNVHYHANFALYINGQRDDFKDLSFYEEVQACTDDSIDNPKSRTHMHNQQNDLVHIHAHSVTWGHFFANLGYSLGNKQIQTDDGVFVDGKPGDLKFILNGSEVDSVANKVIESEDTLLIDYGNSNDEELMERYENINKSASEFNGKYDPSGCSGNESLSPIERLKLSI
ncbi:hypothetical protein KDA00_05305 [Candidatus Saccharibacteria bacterium]|nr:hypothetical protein [Candidatus Saccharibacteria bacterium]